MADAKYVKKILGIDPTLPAHLATKNYVDLAFAALLSDNSVYDEATGLSTITGTTYGDLAAGVDPQVSITSEGTKAFAIWAAQMWNNTSTVGCWMSCAVSGVTTIAASDNNAAIVTTGGTGDAFKAFGFAFFTITPGSNTYTCKYRSGSASQANFTKRQLWVFAP